MDRTLIPATAIQMRAICSRPPRPLPPDTNTPWPHEFCRPAFNAHIELLSHRLGLLNWTAIVQARSTLLRRSSPSGRFRVMLAGDGKCFLEVLDIKPLQSPHAFQHAVFP